MSNLQSGFILQGGKYRIEKALGQGGFGITYLAEQTLMEREVCIKEFFMKEYCDRDEATSQVSLGTTNNKAMMEKYQEKFLKEARLIARLDHPNIIRIHDVFTENNTAYYVMDYIEGKNLNDIVKERGALPETEALGYIIPICEGLEYVHSHRINHLDIKPGNILVRKSDNRPILIDFGMSKQYDEAGDQTSSTPLGISAGYAPLELYQAGGVSSFSPQTDIYELGATLYRLVTGKVPPSASDVMNEGLPEMPAGISAATKTSIEKAMEFRKKDRPSQVKEFLSMLQDSTHDEVHSSPVAENKMENTEANTITTSDKSDQTVLVDIPEAKELHIEDTLSNNSEVPSQSVEIDKDKTREKTPIVEQIPSSPQIEKADIAPKVTAETDKNKTKIYIAAALGFLALVGLIVWLCMPKYNSEEEKKWLKAAKHGDREAQFNIGEYYTNKADIWSKSYDADLAAEGIEWLQKAANQGQVQAQQLLGTYCLFGLDGLNPNDAQQWFFKAAQQGDIYSQMTMGDYFWSKGFREDPKYYKEAAYWYKKAADQGDAHSQNMYGDYLVSHDDIVTDSSWKEAVEWWIKAANNGDSAAQRRIANMYQSPILTGNVLKKDHSEAVKWYKKAADQGDSYSELQLGDYYLAQKSYSEAFEWYQKAASAIIYDSDDAIESSETLYDDFGYVGDDGHNSLLAPVLYRLSDCYKNGWGVTKNKAEANKWYQRAVAYNDYYADMGCSNAWLIW